MAKNRFSSYGLEDDTTEKPAVEPVQTEEPKAVDGTTDNPEAPKEGEPAVANTPPPAEPVAAVPAADPVNDIVKKKALVFLGGTCNGSQWRKVLTDGLTIAFFNPIVENWSDEAKAQEDEIKASADYNLFVFTPLHTGFFSFVEAAISAIKSPSRTILCVLSEDNGQSFAEDKKHSIDAIVAELRKEGIQVLESLDECRTFLNTKEPVADGTSGATPEPIDGVDPNAPKATEGESDNTPPPEGEGDPKPADDTGGAE